MPAPWRIDSDAFYGRPPPAPEEPWSSRLPRHPMRMAALFLGIGTSAVLVDQANPLTQIVFGAPIFEELLKAGLALLIAAGAGWRPRTGAGIAGMAGLAALWIAVLAATAFGFAHALDHPQRIALMAAGAAGVFAALSFAGGIMMRGHAWVVWGLVCGWGVGAGFGVFEHWFSYGSEDKAGLLFRVAFHGFSTGLSLVIFHAARVARSRAMLAMTLPATAVHYFNNYGGIVLIFSLLSYDIEPLILVFAGTMVGLIVVFTLMALALPRAVAGWLDPIVAKLPR